MARWHPDHGPVDWSLTYDWVVQAAVDVTRGPAFAQRHLPLVRAVSPPVASTTIHTSQAHIFTMRPVQIPPQIRLPRPPANPSPPPEAKRPRLSSPRQNRLLALRREFEATEARLEAELEAEQAREDEAALADRNARVFQSYQQGMEDCLAEADGTRMLKKWDAFMEEMSERREDSEEVWGSWEGYGRRA